MRIHWIIKTLVLLSTAWVVSCSPGDSGLLKVRQFHLSSIRPAHRDAEMVRGEQMYRLRGAVTMEERKARLGQYFTVHWKNDQSGSQPLKVVMDYYQAATGSRLKQMSRELPAGQTEGRIEFRVAGEDYRVGGRVLAWRVRLLRAGKVIAEQHSYLWK